MKIPFQSKKGIFFFTVTFGMFVVATIVVFLLLGLPISAITLVIRENGVLFIILLTVITAYLLFKKK